MVVSAATAGQEQTTVVMLSLGDLRPMDNYRKSMDEKKLAELTESVKTKGVVQPILVRPNGKGYEIVFGQRRWMAAKRAGLAMIPSMIRKVSDIEALELQVIENSQREDPNPMEEAIGFKKLLDTGKHTVDTLSSKLDKSRQYVEGRTRLLKLPKDVQDKLVDGSIPIGHALQLTRLKNDGDMKKLAKEMISREMTMSEVKRQLSSMSTEMRKAVFDTAGCHNCGARSQTQTAFFPDAKQDGDRCMDQSCFFMKTKQHYGVVAAALRNMGVTVCARYQDFQAAEKKHGKTYSRVAIHQDDAHYQKPYPKLWKTQCSKCSNRVFCWHEQKRWNGEKVIETEWLCLDKACLGKMNKVKAAKAERETSSGSAPARVSSTEHARSCRDRFLYREVAPRVEKSQALQLRLAIYYLLEHFDDIDSALPPDDAPKKDARRVREDLFKEITGQKLSSGKYSMMSFFKSDDYAAIARIPEKKLTEVLLKIATASVQHTEPEILLLMTPEAGIDLNKSLLVDSSYLNSKTKAELVKLAKPLGINARVTTSGKKLEELSKQEMVDEIMKHDMTGKLPKDIADYCHLKDLAQLAGGKGAGKK